MFFLYIEVRGWTLNCNNKILKCRNKKLQAYILWIFLFTFLFLLLHCICFDKFLLIIGENVGKHTKEKKIYRYSFSPELFPRVINNLEKHDLLPAHCISSLGALYFIYSPTARLLGVFSEFFHTFRLFFIFVIILLFNVLYTFTLLFKLYKLFIDSNIP